MPRASSRAADAAKLGFGIQEGVVRFSRCRFANVQHSKGDGTPTTPFFGFSTDIMKLDEDLKAVNEDDVQSRDFPIAWGSKDTLDLKACKFHPGKADSGDDDDPEDLNCEIGTEGNSMWVEKANFAPFEDSDWILFTRNLEKLGFKPEVNYQSFAPNYDGLVVEVRTVNKEDLCKKFNVRYNPPKDQTARTQTSWEVMKIHVRPYEKKGKSHGTAASATQAVGPNGEPDEETLQLFRRTLNGEGKVEGVLARNKDKEIDHAKIHQLFMPVMTALRIPMPKQKKVLEVIKDIQFWAQSGTEAGISVDVDGKKIGF